MSGMSSRFPTRSIGRMIALGAVGFLLASCGESEEGTREEARAVPQSNARQAAGAKPEDFFGVLRRPPARTPATETLQRLHRQADGMLPSRSGEMGKIDPSKTRDLGTSHGLDVFLLAGEDVICVATREAGAQSGFTIGCDPVKRYVDGYVYVQSGRQPDGSIGVAALVPDAAQEVKVRDSDGAAPRGLGVQDNVAWTTTRGDKPQVMWTDDRGAHERGIMVP
jgi:hypothetical protein